MATSAKIKPGVTVRLRAAQVLLAVTREYRRLDEGLEEYGAGLSDRDEALLRAICYGVMRNYNELFFWLERLMDGPVNRLQSEVRVLILMGLYQLAYMRVPAHAAVNTTVECAPRLRATRSKGLVNALLRAFQHYLPVDGERYNNTIDKQPASVRYAHPSWMLTLLQQDWPEAWSRIARCSNQPAPMTLRLDTTQTSMDEYLSILAAAGVEAKRHAVATSAIVLSAPVDVTALPGFAAGQVSVQDAAAQLAAPLLRHDDSHRVLDACAAPGGKTAHILQIAKPRSLVALDYSRRRLQSVADTLRRINLSAQIVCDDATQPHSWWDKQPFDRILLDVPCSASGVIRRHPDIKYLRSEKALAKVIKRQANLLGATWPLLAPGGMLLYVTCSVYQAENQRQISAFLQRQADAALAPMPTDWGIGEVGRQVLTGDDDMDGFYFALLTKR